jgi:hypothetical protein
MIEPSELEDFVAELRRMGCNPDDFEVMTGERLKTANLKGIYPLIETVAVHRKSSGTLEECRSGHGKAWGAAATLDVRAGRFGSP